MFLYFLALHCLQWINAANGQRSDVSSRVRLKENKELYFFETMGYNFNDRVLFVNILFFWIVIYLVYKKCLNQYLRNAGMALIERNRSSDVLWSLVFNSINIFYLMFLRHASFKQDLIDITLKSYYVHYSGIMIFVQQNWLQGILNFTLTLSVFGFSSKRLQPICVEIFTVNAIHMLILDIYRIGYLKHHTKNKIFEKRYPRFPFVYYFLLWFFLCIGHSLLHFISFPFFGLYITHNEELFYPVCLIELRLISIFVVLLKNVIFPQSWSLWLFPSPSPESVHLTKILSSFKKEKYRKTIENSSVKRQLWQTLVCTMAIKKKISRMKKSKAEKEKAEVEAKEE